MHCFADVNKHKINLSSIVFRDSTTRKGCPGVWALHSDATADTTTKILDAIVDRMGADWAPKLLVVDCAQGVHAPHRPHDCCNIPSTGLCLSLPPMHACFLKFDMYICALYCR